MTTPEPVTTAPQFDADGLNWDDAGEWCEVPCGRTFEDRETALAHIDHCEHCPLLLWGGATPEPVTETSRLEAATRALVRQRSQGLCDENYPNACSSCDCFHAHTKAATGHGFTMERQHAIAVLEAADAADAAAGIRRVSATSSHSAKLGWSNPDTGPASVRLYATDQGESPRWAKPRARVIEDALTEAGSTEGDRFLVIRLGDRFSAGGAS